jgi:hypothetical protein
MVHKILGTVKRGKVKIYSDKQMKYLHFKKLPHTHFVYRGNKLVKKVRHYA